MSTPQTTKHYYLPENGPRSLENLTLTSSPIPPLGDDEVLVKIRAVSVQFRDLLVLWGKYASTPNVIPGSDMAGDVVAVGSSVQDWTAGDRVSANFFLEHKGGIMTAAALVSDPGASLPGVLTEYRAFPTHALVRIPEHLSYEEASTLPCAGATAFNAVHNDVKPGDTVLVQGTGDVSIFGLQFAVALGASVIVTSSSDAKLVRAKELGASHLINYTTTPDWDQEVLRLTDGEGVKFILELGGPESLARVLNAISLEGSISLVASSFNATEEMRFPDVFTPTIMRGAKLRDVLTGSVALFEEMNAFITKHQIRPVIDKVFPFEELMSAYEYLQGQGHVGKVVIRL